MEHLGKIILFLGLGLTLIGALIWGLGKAGFKGLPGDLSYRGENFQFHFPVVTCIVISVLLTLGMWIWRWFNQR